jgi:hypothetical protein
MKEPAPRRRPLIRSAMDLARVAARDAKRLPTVIMLRIRTLAEAEELDHAGQDGVLRSTRKLGASGRRQYLNTLASPVQCC